MSAHSPDGTDYEHRHFVNLAAVAMLLALAICIGWALELFDEQWRKERCVLTQRRDCFAIQAAPRGYIELRR